MDEAEIVVGRWMSTELKTVTPESLLADALDLMTNHRIRHLPVEAGGELVGILSTRDAYRAAMRPSPREGFDALQETKVSDVMTRAPLHTAHPADRVREAAERLCREKVSALPVVEGTRLVGIVTSEDLLWALMETSDS